MAAQSLSISCPGCVTQVSPEQIEIWAGYGAVPLHCANCGIVFWVGVCVEQHEIKQPGHIASTAQTVNGAQPEQELPVGSVVELVIREHPLYGKVGLVIEKRYGHYRVDIAGRTLLVPHNWVKPYGRCTNNNG